MRLGLYCGRGDLEWDKVLSLWEAADQVPEIESAWTFDHLHIYPADFLSARPGHVQATSRSASNAVRAIRRRLGSWRTTDQRVQDGPCLEGWTALAGLLALTERLRGGVLVTAMFLRPPALLAKMVATVDIISQGRLELGLGSGWSTDEAGAYGIELGGWRERFDRLDEGIECLTSLLANPTTTFHGKYFQLCEAPCEPKPVQRPHPPICIGGAGERRTIPAVARWATTWHAGFEVDALPRKIDVFCDECQRIGRDPATVTIAMTVFWDGCSTAQLNDEFGHLADAGVQLVLVSLPRCSPDYLPRMVDANKN